MLAPKIEICIEGYNIEQTDFYIAHLIDKYNSLNELYKKSCEHIVFLEKECKDGFDKSFSEITNKLDSIESRVSDLENKFVSKNISVECSNVKDNGEKFITELSDFHSELKDIKSLFAK